MLKIKDLTLHYGAAKALHEISLTAKKGEVTAIMGRNGVGKTSLIRAISGRHRPSGGTITWDGADITRAAPEKRARVGVATVPQGREIFAQLTVRENLETGLAPLSRADKYVPEEVFELFPVLKEMLGRRGGDLSGGQQQQLAIGRALVTRPGLLLLDEPTEGIQPSIIKDIGRAIDYLRSKGDMAIVLVEQYFEFAHELADQIVVLDRGYTRLSGRTETLDEAELRAALSV
ncbi:MAG: urea transport system ATP-binding protein [Paracoccaceae bacterium]|jgi:urea transport system ATP-binding protein